MHIKSAFLLITFPIVSHLFEIENKDLKGKHLYIIFFFLFYFCLILV